MTRKAAAISVVTRETRTNSVRLVARKRVSLGCSFGFFDHGFWPDDYDHAFVGDGILGAVCFHVVADYRACRQVYVTIDDGIANAAFAADIEVIEDDALIDFAVTVDANIEAQDGFGDSASRNNGAGADDGADSRASAFRVGEHKFGGRKLV